MINTSLVQEITKITDLDRLREITSGVIGEVCWRANFSYGDELNIHIGAKIPYSQKSLTGKQKGAWILGTRATLWTLDSENETLATLEDDPEVLKQKIQVVEGTAITAIEISYRQLALSVKFSNGCRLRLFSSSETDCDLPYWEMFTPYHMVLKVGPGAMWSYTPSDR